MKTSSRPSIAVQRQPALKSTHSAAQRTPQRSDGEDSRERLLVAAVNCFAEKGFADTSIRDVAARAGVNVASISYYFGDKAGLYRAAFTEPMGSPKDDIALFDDPDMTIEEAIGGMFFGFIEPLKANELVQQCIRLHMREMVEPTGLWEEEIKEGISPYHTALMQLLCRHYRLKKIDDDIMRLALNITAMGVFLYVGRDLNMRIHPQIVSTPKALDVMHERLVMYALAMIEAEGRRRNKKPETKKAEPIA